MVQFGTIADLQSFYAEAAKAGRTPGVPGRTVSFAGADVSGFDFRGKVPDDSGFLGQLLGTDFRNATMVRCILAKTDWVGANLRGAKLLQADMRAGNFYSTRFEEADLSGADLRLANLNTAELLYTRLRDANVAGARFGRTILGGVDLSEIAGLADAVHVSPSIISSDTLRRTATGLSDAGNAQIATVVRFLQSAGVDDELIDVFRGWIGKPIRYHSTFLSHSSLDKSFARRLYQDLRSLGVSCWFDEKQLLPGDVILDSIDHGIRLWDKVILVCSKHSLDPRTGWWIEQEVERALVKEREIRKATGDKATVLIPITIDDFLFTSSGALHATLTQRYVGDFRGWRDATTYSQALSQLVSALNAARPLSA